MVYPESGSNLPIDVVPQESSRILGDPVRESLHPPP